MSDQLQEAFFEVCNEAKPAGHFFVCLYVQHPFFGGPEEGGWWGTDTELVAYDHCNTKEEADAKLAALKSLADRLNKQALSEFGDHCLRQTAWLDERGLDDSFLPEVDGETSYCVTVEEDKPGERVSRGSRCYE